MRHSVPLTNWRTFDGETVMADTKSTNKRRGTPAGRDREATKRRGTPAGRDREAGKAGYDGKRQLSTKMVVNPHSVDRDRDRVPVNVLHDPIEYMFARGQIDLPEKKAGDRIRALFETVGVGSTQAIDYGRTKVDGGQVWQGVSEDQLAANAALARLAPEVGKVGYALLIRVAGEGRSITDVARALCGKANPDKRPDKRDVSAVARMVRDALTEAAIHFGYAAPDASPASRVLNADLGA